MKICAGIVLYNPDIQRLKYNITNILPQVEVVYLVDNASNNIEEIEKLIKNINSFDIHLITNEKNLGIATALNQLCRIALFNKYDWILTLDQDTICPDGMIQEMTLYTSDEKIGIICPSVYYQGGNGKRNTIKKNRNTADYYKLKGGIQKKYISEDITYVYACMTSASLTNVKMWNEIGGFRDDYFIDFVDNEFCMRMAINGYRILRVNRYHINHQLGETKEKQIFGIFKFTSYSHVPWRFYYMVRNNRAFIKEYGCYLPIIKEYIKLWNIIFYGIIHSDKKLCTLKYMVKGYKDAGKGINGKLLDEGR